MAIDQTPAVIPVTVSWRLRNARTHVEREFEQSELAIEGEARIVGLGRKIGILLNERGYTWAQINDLMTNEADTDWRAVLGLIDLAGDAAPDIVADAATILLGIYPANEDGTPNEAFEADRRFLRSAVSVAKFVEMVDIFRHQNDYARMLAPFGLTLSNAMAAFAGRSSAPVPSPDPSGPQQVVGIDGSMVELEPFGTPRQTPTMTEAQPSESAINSEVSPD